MTKILEAIQKLLTGLFILIIALSFLTWLGAINPFEAFESATRDSVEEKLRVDAITGNADAQNKLGTLLYISAKKQSNGDFSEAIKWFEKANQQHPIAQLNLAFAYKGGNGVLQNNDTAIEYFHQSGINFLRIGFPMDAKDCVYSIQQINTEHPLKKSLIQKISEYEELH
ncbi:MAG: hypothetical protein A6F70_07670 [Cycloclasticus sp. symbiont of Bathymodiolus heckerae]|nr:MAG: hypothetical protein A6F70_07670 [Cycloclasticus sp. symbiont of Bathymodiolus heckerae]